MAAREEEVERERAERNGARCFGCDAGDERQEEDLGRGRIWPLRQRIAREERREVVDRFVAARRRRVVRIEVGRVERVDLVWFREDVETRDEHVGLLSFVCFRGGEEVFG